MANKQIKKYHHRSFTFAPEDIDLASEFICEILDAFGLPRKDTLRTRLSLEEILLNWRQEKGLSEAYTIDVSRRMGRISVTVLCQGVPCDPIAKEEDSEAFGTGNLGQAVLENLGLSPS